MNSGTARSISLIRGAIISSRMACLLVFALLYSIISVGYSQSQTVLNNVAGSISFSIMNQNTEEGKSQTWLIQPPNVDTILLTFNTFNVVNLGIKVYDYYTNNIVFSCISCGTDMPPSFYSPSGAVFISAQGARALNFLQCWFSLQFVGVPSLPANQRNTSISTQMNMGYGRIFPRLANGQLAPYSIQKWRISQATKRIVLSMSNFHFPSTSCGPTLVITDYDSNNDMILEQNGRILYRGCKSSHAIQNWLYSSSKGFVGIVLRNDLTSFVTLDFQIDYYADTELFQCGSLIQPDILNENSFILTDGSASTNYMHRGTTCSWQISPENAGTITLFFQWVSLKYGGTVTVYDGPSQTVNKGVLWYGSGPTLTTPPPIKSTGSSLFINFVTNTLMSDGFYGFFAQYQTNFLGSLGIGAGQTVLSMSSAIDIVPPGDGSHYAPNFTFTWFINPSTVRPTSPITFVLGNLQLSGYDSLTIYNEPNMTSNSILATLSGNVLPNKWFTTRGNSAILVFRSGGGGSSLNSGNGAINITAQKRGNFRLSYFSDGPNYHCGFSTNPGVLTAPSMQITDGSSSVETMYSNQQCDWYVAPVKSSDIYIYFTRFDLTGATLNIFIGAVHPQGSILVSYTDSTAIPAPIFAPYPTLGLQYNSSSDPAGLGFAMGYFGISSLYLGPGGGIIPLLCSSVVSITLKNGFFYNSSSTVPPNTNITWLIKPLNATGSIYFFFSSFNFDGCNEYLDIYDGDSTNAPLLGRYCGKGLPQPYAWINTTGTQALVNFVSTSSSAKNGRRSLADFDVSYYSDGPNTHCGIGVNPATMTAPSMMFTDGSTKEGKLYLNQLCEWVIAPSNVKHYYNLSDWVPPLPLTNKTAVPTAAPTTWSSSSSIPASDVHDTYGIIAMEFLESDLAGATLEVYDGVDDSSRSTLLWKCMGCSVKPRTLIAHSGNMFVRYNSQQATSSSSNPTASSDMGMGFRAVYWTMEPNAVYNQVTDAQGRLLELPYDFTVEATKENYTVGWDLGISEKPSTLIFPPFIEIANISSAASHTLDGRSDDSRFLTPFSPSGFCGMVKSHMPSYLSDKFFIRYQASQYVDRYISSFRPQVPNNQASSNQGPFNAPDVKNVITFKGTWGDTSGGKGVPPPPPPPPPPSVSSINGVPIASSDIMEGAPVCKYYIDSGSDRAVDIYISNVVGLDTSNLHGRLRIWAGLTGNDLLVLDTAGIEYSVDMSHHPVVPVHVTSIPSHYVAPCGKSTIILEYYNSVDQIMGLNITYHIRSDDMGAICLAYQESLRPKKKKPDKWLPYKIAAGAFGGLLGIVILIYYLRKYKHVLKCPSLTVKRRIAYKVVSKQHPRYTPRLDRFRNRFLLKPGKCCICHDDPIKVIKITNNSCNHGLCLEDLKGYLEAALGDISMFPVKCPMHFEGCKGEIDSKIAKRVLNKALYERFLEFSDRAMYGDGMRCIFCTNYVNYPPEGVSARVECPYCVQRFCIRCKAPWHYKSKCPLDNVDDSLEAWKKDSGAQKCPSCHKLIEKDGDGCNHMVHKITDGIPCTQDRTDFCYLCGEAVTPDYPHEEVECPGVNHFPDGVFQNCRSIINKEREAERERLLRIRRTKGKNPPFRNGRTAMFGSPTGGSNRVSVSPGLAEDLEMDAETLAFLESEGFDLTGEGLGGEGDDDDGPVDYFDQAWNNVLANEGSGSERRSDRIYNYTQSSSSSSATAAAASSSSRQDNKSDTDSVSSAPAPGPPVAPPDAVPRSPPPPRQVNNAVTGPGGAGTPPVGSPFGSRAVLGVPGREGLGPQQAPHAGNAAVDPRHQGLQRGPPPTNAAMGRGGGAVLGRGGAWRDNTGRGVGQAGQAIGPGAGMVAGGRGGNNNIARAPAYGSGGMGRGRGRGGRG